MKYPFLIAIAAVLLPTCLLVMLTRFALIELAFIKDKNRAQKY